MGMMEGCSGAEVTLKTVVGSTQSKILLKTVKLYLISQQKCCFSPSKLSQIIKLEKIPGPVLSNRLLSVMAVMTGCRRID
jgi:hypothetical protein